MGDPDVFVVLKEGDSHGTRAGTPLCVELDERTARYRKIGNCVRYIPASRIESLSAASLVDVIAQAIYAEEDGLGPAGSDDRRAAMGEEDPAHPWRTWERAPEWERDDYRMAAKAVLRVVEAALK